MTPAGLAIDGGTLQLCSPEPGNLRVEIVPAPKTIQSGEIEVPGKPDGVFVVSSRPRQYRFHWL